MSQPTQSPTPKPCERPHNLPCVVHTRVIVGELASCPVCARVVDKARKVVSHLR